MIVGVHHVAISTPDLDRLVSFYCDNFGFEVSYRNAWRENLAIDQLVGLDGSVARVAMLRAVNTHIEVFEYAAPAPAEASVNRPVCDHGYTHFCLEVEDIEEEYQRLMRGGMRFHCPPISTGSSGNFRAAYGRDPDGNVIELVEHGDSESPMRLETLTGGIADH
ncbi:MAG: VOC family protein [Acidimicrobiales bacterium]|nr:VOC family protein [Acidimicrobiales bacterium]